MKLKKPFFKLKEKKNGNLVTKFFSLAGKWLWSFHYSLCTRSLRENLVHNIMGRIECQHLDVCYSFQSIDIYGSFRPHLGFLNHFPLSLD